MTEIDIKKTVEDLIKTFLNAGIISLELRKKGLIKIKNFKKNPSKINYIYLLTPAGIEHKLQLTVSFMKKKLKEYDDLKREFEKENKDDLDRS